MRMNLRLAGRVVLATLVGCSALSCRPAAPAASAAPASGRLADPRQARLAAEFRLEAARLGAGVQRTADVRPYHVLSYDLKGRFDWTSNTLYGTVGITLQLDAGAAPSLLLDSQVDAVDAVQVGGRALPFTANRAVGQLTVDLSSLAPADRLAALRLDVTYRTVANSNGAGIPDFQTDALRAVSARQGDPVTSRTVNTYAEPTGARQWMPCHDDPADRATFAVELTMPAGEALIANGALTSDHTDEATQLRTMRYQTRYTLPTYLMAFAEGEFTSASTMHGSLPIAVWARRGVPVDFQGILAQTTRQLSLYESLLFPYPFEKYDVVLLPEFQGGEEHASITFINETEDANAQLAGDRSMNGHEMAHQWFGDYMTVASWDDLWVKEGMATLIESEQGRPYTDENGSGRLFASQFQITATDAIVDRSLDPEAKYTSGPYGRAAWLITQLRSAVGEETFWQTLRGVLRAHAYGNITGEEFLAAFRTALGDARWQQALQSLPAKTLPQVTVTPVAGGAAGNGPAAMTLSLADPQNLLIVPLDVRAYADATTYASVSLTDGGKVTIPNDAQLWVLDPQDRQPVSSFFPDQTAFTGAVLPLLAPRSDAARAVFAMQPASVQQLPMYSSQPWFADAKAFTTAYQEMASEEAKALALQMACASALASGVSADVRSAWADAVAKVLVDPPYLGVSSWYVTPSLGRCTQVTGAIFATEVAQLTANPADPDFSIPQLVLLTSLGIAPSDALAAFGAVGSAGPSVLTRLAAVRSLLTYLTSKQQMPKPDAATLPDWQRYFRTLLAQTQVQEIQSVAIQGVLAGNDTAALPALAALVTGRADAPIEDSAACAAYTLTKPVPAAWTAFVSGLGDQTKLPDHVRAKLAHPETCG